jgi:hypothetical protein
MTHVWRFVRVLLRTLVPSFPFMLWFNAKKVQSHPDGKDADEHRRDWEETLQNSSGDTNEMIARAYQASTDRIAGLEAKGIGMLQAVAIIAAGAVVALTGNQLSTALALAGLGFVVSAGAACCWIIIPRARWTLTLSDIKGPTKGYAEMATATRMAVPVNIRTANMVTAAVYDAIRALIVIVAALVVFGTQRGTQSTLTITMQSPGATPSVCSTRAPASACPGPTPSYSLRSTSASPS